MYYLNVSNEWLDTPTLAVLMGLATCLVGALVLRAFKKADEAERNSEYWREWNERRNGDNGQRRRQKRTGGR